MSEKNIKKTRSGRIIKKPKRFSDEKFLKGSGSGINGIDFDGVDKSYDGDDKLGDWKDFKKELAGAITDNVYCTDEMKDFIVNDIYEDDEEEYI